MTLSYTQRFDMLNQLIKCSNAIGSAPLEVEKLFRL